MRHYEVVTPNATMSVRGTVFEIDREAAGLVSLMVYDGNVALEMDGHEPVLCNAGEYIQFEEGNPPKVIVDRESVSEELINEQMRQRLEKINQSGRGLNLGSVKIADNEPADELPDQEQEPEVTPEPVVEPETVVTPEPAPTAETGNTPEPAATSKPERTPKPVPTAVPAPTPEPPQPTAAPAPEQPKPTAAPTPVPEQPKPTPVPTPVPEQPKPTPVPTPVPEQPKPTPAPVPTPVPEQPKPTPAPTPAPEPPKPTPAPTPAPEPPKPTAAPTPAPEQPKPTPDPIPTPEPWPTAAPVQEYTVTFANPCVWVDGTLEKISDVYETDGTCVRKSVEAGKTMEMPEEMEIVPVTNGSGVKLKLSGWYLEHGEEWNFDTYIVNSDFTLYPVWEEVTESDAPSENAGDTVVKKYWPVIFEGVNQREHGNGASVCVCLPEGTNSMPKEDLNGDTIKGWEKIYGGTVENKGLWDALVDSVQGVTVLKVWEGVPEPPVPQPAP